MSIEGIGNDIIEISRIRGAYEEHGRAFLDRLFTPKEQAYCSLHKDPVPRYAGRFAAKESIAKALGTGIGSQASWHDIEILANGDGKPEVHFSGELKKRFKNPKVLITISHCKEYASAVAIWLQN